MVWQARDVGAQGWGIKHHWLVVAVVSVHEEQVCELRQRHWHKGEQSWWRGADERKRPAAALPPSSWAHSQTALSQARGLGTSFPQEMLTYGCFVLLHFSLSVF